jgi:hypothetical protein
MRLRLIFFVYHPIKFTPIRLRLHKKSAVIATGTVSDSHSLGVRGIWEGCNRPSSWPPSDVIMIRLLWSGSRHECLVFSAPTANITREDIDGTVMNCWMRMPSAKMTSLDWWSVRNGFRFLVGRHPCSRTPPPSVYLPHIHLPALYI